jgi:hypothetical protein
MSPPVVGNTARDTAPTCLDVAADIAVRAPDAWQDKDHLRDYDGDDIYDRDYRGPWAKANQNVVHYLYGSFHNCWRYLGSVIAEDDVKGPGCWQDAPADGTLCTIEAWRVTPTGEQDRYFYDYGPDGYHEAELDLRVPP